MNQTRPTTTTNRPMKGIPRALNGSPPDHQSDIMVTLEGVAATLAWLSLATEAETDGGIDVPSAAIKSSALDLLTRNVQWAKETLEDTNGGGDDA